MKKINPLFILIAILLCLLYWWAYTQWTNMNKQLDKYVFYECVRGNENDLEYRKACVNYSKAYRDKSPYEAFGGTLVWDETVYKYMPKNN